ncbi:hypothetical protein C8R45DRAFT_931885 [Mycena sanguinolenta]|nr:hypothetical protein C8R45DRAFT_931885 [Mycena sanguinolenta]
MSSHSTSQSSSGSFSQKKRIYVACLNCRKRKVKCITPDEQTPCKRCTEKGLECEYVPVCVEREKALFTEEIASLSSHRPGTPSWGHAPQAPGANSASYANNHYGQQHVARPNSYYGESQYTQPSGSPYTQAPYPPQQQPQFPNNPLHGYPATAYPPQNQSPQYPSSGMPYPPSAIRQTTDTVLVLPEEHVTVVEEDYKEGQSNTILTLAP